MSKKFFVLPFFILIVFFTIAVHKGFTDVQSIEWPEISQLPGSVWADTYAAKGQDTWLPVDVHIVVQSLAAAHWDRSGHWFVHSVVTGAAFGSDVDSSDYFDGCYETSKVKEYKAYASTSDVIYDALAHVTDTTSGIKVKSSLLDPDDPGPLFRADGPGIYPTDPNQMPIPGDTYEFKVITDTDYYWIDVYVKAPGDTSERGTQIGDGALGDGTSTEATFSYTFPTSGTTDATGDYLITAVIWRGGDMSEYTETSTVTVNPPWPTE